MKSEAQSLPGEQAPLRDLAAPASWRALALVSDLHLGAQAPRTTAGFLRWLRGEATRADALLLLGDVFETWVGDDLLLQQPADEHHAVCDALCIDDLAYMRWRETCRDPAWQARMLAQPLALRRQQAAAAREQSRQAQAARQPSDADPAEARRWMLRERANWMIHGHTHRPREHWQDAQLRQVLSDWDLDDAAAPRAQVLWLRPARAWVRVDRETAAT